MRLPAFTYYQPTTVEEAHAALIDHPGARVLAGGTDLLVNMKHRVESPEELVGLSRVGGLRGVTREPDRTVIGARTTLKEIQKDARLAADFPALVQAAGAVGSYRHQTMGTVAGNLCQNTRCRFFNQSLEWRSVRSLCYKAGGEHCHVMNKDGVCYSTYHGDVAPALLVLDAQVRVLGADGVREIAVGDLYSGEGAAPLALAPTDLITAVIVPASSAGPSAYRKHALRGAIDFPQVGAAVWRGDGVPRVAFTAVDRAPQRATVLENALAGAPFTEELIQSVASLAAKGATITRTTIIGVPHKRNLMSALFLRAASDIL